MRNRVTTAAIVVLALMAGRRLSAQTPAAQSQTADDKHLAFDVASVKPTNPQDNEIGTMLVYPGGRLEARGCTLKLLIQVAYRLKDFQISDGPSWTTEDRFSITAKPPADSQSSRVNPSNPKLPPPEEELLMMRSLLADRFQLVVHEETEQRSGLGLVLKNRSSKLMDAKDKEAFPVVAFGNTGNSERPNFLQGINAPMAKLAERLSDLPRSPVADQTGLQGSFDFKIEYVADARDTNAAGPQLSTAIQDIGLKLESTKVPVSHLIIDHAEKPSPN